MTYLGGRAVEIVVYEFEDPTLRGYYNRWSRTVALNRTLLDTTAYECMFVCLHECYHAYQYDCIASMKRPGVNRNLRLYEEVAEWQEEFKNYQGAPKDCTQEEYDAYASQKVEQSANAYSKKWAPAYSAYIERISEY